MDELFKAIRSACPSGIWSRGVELARVGAATLESRETGELTFRVRVPKRIVAPTVVLYVEDSEWDCDCESRIDGCEHAAAAAITARRAEQEGVDLESDAARGPQLEYHFEEAGGTLGLVRVIVDGEQTQPLVGTLTSLAARREQGRVLAPTQDDLTIDRMIANQPGGTITRSVLSDLLLRLAGRSGVRLANQPVTVASDTLAPIARAQEVPDGFRLVIEADPRITRVVAPGVALAGETLFRLADTDLTGPRLELLPSERHFGRHQVHELAFDILPGLKRRLPVRIESGKLPTLQSGLRPRISLEVEQVGHTLTVFPTLVYGDPAVARIDAGRLVHLGGDVPIRDEAAERTLVQRLRDLTNLVPGARSTFDGDGAAGMAATLATWSGEIRGTRPGALVADAALTPRLDVDGTRVTVEFQATTADGRSVTASGADVIAAWRGGHSVVPLVGGGWANLPAGVLERLGDTIADLLAARDEATGAVARFALPVLAELCEALNQPAPLDVTRLRPMLTGFDGIPEAVLPPDLNATLRPYQRAGVNWLSFMRDSGLGATLADDMGLGKTLQTLSVLEGRTLVVCPRSVVFNWTDEIARFRPGLTVALYHGPSRALDPEANVTLTTYAVLRLDRDALAAIEWDTVVLDEAQAIKNPESQVTQAAYALNARFKVSLSGTPVENRLDELWSQFHFTNRGLLGGRGDFDARFSAPIALGTPGAAAALRHKIAPFVLRRLKRDVVPELPPRSDAVLYCALSDEERAVYDAIRATTQKEVVERLRAGGSVMEALEALLRLRQAACHTALVPGQHAATSSKVRALADALERARASEHRCLVFSQWTSLLDLVEPHLRDRELAFSRLDGSTRDRRGVVEAFQSETGPDVMLLSLKAGGTGLNLTAADHVFLLDLWWNPAVEDQAADRAHRIGQSRPVMVHRLVARDTVEERILALQASKRALAQAALEGGEQALALSREDLLGLLE